MALTANNYNQGFLVDEELLAGITESPDQAGVFVGYVLRHTTGEYLGHQPCESLSEALEMINRIPRHWIYEATKSCDGSRCAEGQCKGEGCRVFDKNLAAMRIAGCSPPS